MIDHDLAYQLDHHYGLLEWKAQLEKDAVHYNQTPMTKLM